ncbi:unnamed protein product, partial [Brenthis ino]
MTQTEKHSDYNMSIWLRCCEEEIKKPIEGKLTGTIPTWLSGTLLRNGSGTYKIGESEYGHVFDGPALLHRFYLKNGNATYQCRYLNSKTFNKNRKANRIVVTEFGTRSVPDPCHSIFDRIASTFTLEDYFTDNAGISVQPFGDQIYTMTEIATVYKIDPDSLETLDRKTLINSLIVCHTAHPHVMPNGDVYNIGLQFIKGLPKHVILKFSHTGKENMFESAEIVGVVDPKWRFNPSYMHSFGITKKYFIIIEQPLCISILNTMKKIAFNEPFSTMLEWYSEYETQFILIHRETGEQIRYRADTFFFMHIINCFEENGKLFIDVSTYKDAKLIDAMYVEAIKNIESNLNFGQWCHSRPKRIEIPLNAAPDSKVETKLLADVCVEVPRINYQVYNGRPYRYFYGISLEVGSEHAGSIIKIDNKTGEIKMWREFDAHPSEPVFVACPDAKDEDDGVILSSVLWSKDDHAVTLLVLNARDLNEIGRVQFVTPSQAARCFHGWYLPDRI